ncbi:diaminopimelate epimerase [Croceitalea rosinachiae]|uniref:Diaminopimelate epimerase n=1 Tax=Croceitalea rosinachiae TaxID=3075596 RepID=A0ABU3ACH8_9FLAO|nr:diaminopimelate epimerase [Croceitalea sp. F388]MDT0607247.1 diaminopimelate epimerase [Croceitalea sp. F388]
MNLQQKLLFYKYQGTGNDFVLIDNRNDFFSKNDTRLIKFLCDRRFGIGADGLILLENDKVSDFKMIYYNSDGNQSTMCGNGGRCIVAFAKLLDIIDSKTVFSAIDGLHHAAINGSVVSLQMIDVHEINSRRKHFFLNTGSPHHVQIVSNLDTLAVHQEGAKIRYGIYGEEGSNINFVDQVDSETFNIRTYERGVEGETLSCGTGVTAVALAMHKNNNTKSDKVNIVTRGGKLQVTFTLENNSYTNVRLIGEATLVFKGEIRC